MKFYKEFALGITSLLINISSVILKEKLRFTEISARKLHFSAVIVGPKVLSFLKIKVLDFIIRLCIFQ